MCDVDHTHTHSRKSNLAAPMTNLWNATLGDLHIKYSATRHGTTNCNYETKIALHLEFIHEIDKLLTSNVWGILFFQTLLSLLTAITPKNKCKWWKLQTNLHRQKMSHTKWNKKIIEICLPPFLCHATWHSRPDMAHFHFRFSIPKATHGLKYKWQQHIQFSKLLILIWRICVCGCV